VHKLIQVYKIWHETLPNISKYSRYSLGLKIDSLFLEVIESILSAISAHTSEKHKYLREASKSLDLLQFFLQIAWEVKAVSDKKFLLLSEKLVVIGKMLGGWIKRAQ
jgi:hypothetical protein